VGGGCVDLTTAISIPVGVKARGYIETDSYQYGVLHSTESEHLSTRTLPR
jgi:hypothetical protein